MRHVAMLLLGLALLLPAVATARPQGSSECRYLTNQINFFETRLERAQQLGNSLWEDRLGSHLDGLKKRRESMCPGYGDSQEALKAFAQLLDLAAQGAVTFFTMGAF